MMNCLVIPYEVMYVGDHIYADTQLGRLEDDSMMTARLLHMKNGKGMKTM